MHRDGPYEHTYGNQHINGRWSYGTHTLPREQYVTPLQTQHDRRRKAMQASNDAAMADTPMDLSVRVFSGGGSGMCCWGAMVERQRREGRGAEGAEVGGVCPLPRKFFFISELKMAHFGAFWLLFFQLNCVYYFTWKKSGIIGLRKLVAVEPKPELEC